MTFILDLADATSDTSLPIIQSYQDLEAQILALPGLRGWWDATKSDYRVLTSGKISQLTDRSGGGRHMLQATDASRPTVGADYFVAGMDAAVCAGAQVMSCGNFFSAAAASNITLFEIYKATGEGSQVPASAASPNTLSAYSVSGGASVNCSGNSVFVTTPSLNTNMTIVHAMDTTNAFADVNGATNTSAGAPTANALPAAGATAFLGAYQGGALYLTGGIGQIMIFEADLRDTDGAVELLKLYAALRLATA